MHEIHAHTRHDGVCSPQQDCACSDPQTPTPTGDSWNNDVRDLFPKVSRCFIDLYAFDAAQESEGLVPTRNQLTVPSSNGTRTASVVTLFPRRVEYGRVLKEADTPQSKYSKEWDLAARNESFFKKHYRRLKEIHDSGPPGETQMFIAGMNSYLKEWRNPVESDMCSSRQKDEANSEPLSESTGQQQRPDQSIQQPPSTHSAIDGQKPRTRKDSAVSYGNISCTSQEVPLKIRRTVLEMDTNKPLPPMPQLHTTPAHCLHNGKGKAMNTNKPLPRTPLDCSSISEKQALEPVEDSPVDASWESIHTQTMCSAPSAKQPKASQVDAEKVLQCTEQETERTWLDDFTDDPKVRIPPGGEPKLSKAEKAHDALKAKISRPMPITHTIDSRSPGFTLDVGEKAKGKPKTPSLPTWLDKLAHPTLPAIPSMPAMPTFYKPKKRPASDESFACQGLRGSNVYAEIIMGGAER